MSSFDITKSTPMWYYLPSETVIHIFSFLPHNALCRIALVNHQFDSLSCSNILWSALCKKTWLIDDHHNETEHGNNNNNNNAEDAAATATTNHEEESDHDHGTTSIQIDRQYKRQRSTTTTTTADSNNDNDVDTAASVFSASNYYKQLFKNYYLEYARYIDCYATIRGIWNKLESWTRDHAPHIFRNLKDGTSDDELNELEDDLGVVIPDEFRCFLRIHNGQRKPQNLQDDSRFHGLFGGYEFYGYHINQRLMTLNQIRAIYLQIKSSIMQASLRERHHQHRPPRNRSSSLPVWLINCLPIVKSYEPGDANVFLVLQDFTERNVDNAPQLFRRGQVVTHTQAFVAPFLLAHSFTRWVAGYATDLVDRNMFEVSNQGEIIRFPTLSGELGNGGSDVTTNHVRIRANALFIPQRSAIEDTQQQRKTHFFFAYRIRISMAPDAPPTKQCQLESRHWIITDGAGKSEEVQGPGVIGLYPIVSPGSYFEYCSCTHQTTHTGSMRGTMQMRSAATGELFDAVVGEFALNVPTPL